TDEEIDEQELEAHYSYMAKIQEVPTADSGTDFEPLEQNDQNDVESDDERANLIANLKLDTEFEKYKAFNDHTVDYDKLECQLNETLGQLAQKYIEIQEGFKTKAYEISVVKEKHDELIKQSLLTKSHYEGLVKKKKVITDLKLREEHDIDKMLLMEKQLKFLNEFVYKRSQSIQTIHMMAPKVPTYNGRPTFANPRYLKQAQSEILYALAELQCLYLHKVKEYDCLAEKLSKQTESVCKEVHNELLQRFSKVEKHSISLEIALQKYKEQVKNDTVWNERASNVFQKEREEYIEIQDLEAKLQDKNIAISELKKLIKKGKRKSVDTKFDKPSVVRQPNAQRIPKSSVLVNRLLFQILLREGTFQRQGVNHKTNVSKLQQKSNQLKDKVLPNNSQVKPKKTQVEKHLRISSISNKSKSITACNNSLNSRTSNVNADCATCKKCLVDYDHFACVTKMLNDVNARTKKPNVVPISTRKPKGYANKSVATPHKKKVASKPTNQKP
nr:hypothetical protein [Tanacetum cinerariifolium]